MTTYTFYADATSGYIATLKNWQSTYSSDDIERFISDGRFKCVELKADDNSCYITSRLSYSDVKEWEEYLQEWACNAEDEEGNCYEIRWEFAVVKGGEPEDGNDYAWHDESCISAVAC